MVQPLHDVALSFAGEQRNYVRDVARVLNGDGVRYFFDEERQVDLWGHNLIDELDAAYRLNARCVVMFISEQYAAKVWTNLERQSAQSRALAESDPYILPVRFDDTDLPGLPPSVHYIDARTTTAEELGDVIVQKVDTMRQADPTEDREAGWEYLLLVAELEHNLAAFDSHWRDFQMKYAPPTGRRIGREDVPDDVSSRAATAAAIAANMGRLFEPDTVEQALGAPGEPGDADLIRHLAARLGDSYGALLRWAAEARGALIPDEARDVYWALADYADAPLRQIRSWVQSMTHELRPAVENLRAGLVPGDEPIVLDFSLVITIPEDTQARWHEALERLDQS